jgi:hypothetical protein
MNRSIAPFNAPATGGVGRAIRDGLAEAVALLFASATFQPRPKLEREVRERIKPTEDESPAATPRIGLPRPD